jgi:hypothetical protein
MASVWRHPLSKYWTACFRDLAGKQRRITTKETDRKRAQRLAEEYESAVRTKRTLRQAQLVLDRLHEETSGQAVQRKTLRAYCAEWIATKEPETAPRTQVIYRTSTAKFIAFLGERAELPVSDLTKADIVAYRNSLAKTLSAKSANRTSMASFRFRLSWRPLCALWFWTVVWEKTRVREYHTAPAGYPYDSRTNSRYPCSPGA